MNILGLETSCDETSAAVVRDGHQVLSSIVFTQIAQHRPYGGVVPEIASRMHVEHLPDVINEAIHVSGLSWADIDAVAVTNGPGLATSLLVGLSGAKGLALRLNKPLLGINHLEAHIYSIFLDNPALPPALLCPFLALIVSGGHTCFIQIDSIGAYRQLGRTMDDAAGEAFDKGANLLGLGYPGGPAIDKAARNGNMEFVSFPRGHISKIPARMPDLLPKYCVSFSGLKTSLLYHIKNHPLGSGPNADINNLAASYQEAIVDTLVKRASYAADSTKVMAVVGGVSLNTRLREKLTAMAEKKQLRLILASPRYCTDNAAMVAGLAFHKMATRLPLDQAMALDVDPNLGIGSN